MRHKDKYGAKTHVEGNEFDSQYEGKDRVSTGNFR